MATNQCESHPVSASFRKTLSQTAFFHDWYLKDIYVSNTGKGIEERSKSGYTTVQIEMCTSNNDISYLLVFLNVSSFSVSMEHSCDVSKYSFTSFGRCSEYSIVQCHESACHVVEFEGGSRISIRCQNAKCKKIVNTPFL